MQNLNRRQKLRYRQIARWVSAYMLIVVLVVLVVWIISAVAINAIEQAAYREQEEKMHYARASIDTVLEDVESAMVQLANDGAIVTLSSREMPYTPSQLYMLYDLNRQIGQYVVTHSAWDGLYAYFCKDEYVLEGGAKRTPEEVYAMQDYGITQLQWQQMIYATDAPTYRRIPSAADAQLYHVEYWYPMIGHASDMPLGIFVVRLDEGELTKRMAALCSYSEEWVAAVNEQGSVMFSSESAQSEKTQSMQALMSLVADEVNLHVIEGKFSLGISTSLINGWRYVSVLPSGFLTANTQYNERIAQTVCLILLVIGVMVSIGAALCRFRPLGRLFTLAEMAGDGAGQSEKNPYRYLENSMVTMLEQNREAQQRLRRQNRLVRTDLLIRLITGNLRSIAAMDDILFSNGISFVSDRFVVLVLRCENEQDPALNEDAAMARFVIGNIFEELFTQAYNAFFFEYAGVNIGLINLNEQQGERLTESIRERYDQGNRVIQQHFGMRIRCALSRVYVGHEGISRAYNQAMEVAEYQQLVGDGADGFTSYDQIAAEESKGDGTFSVDAQIRFMQHVKTGHFEQAWEVMTREIEEARRRAPFDLERARCFMFAVMNALLEAVNEIGENVEQDFFERVQPTQRLLHCNSIGNMQQQMEAILNEASEYLRRKKKDRGDKIVQQVADYVSLQYMDVNINVSSIADEMGMSVSGLSRLFKKKTGQGLLDYIVQVRMEAAKRLLRETDLTLADIAERVGLINVNTLIRTFKRYTGLTPGKYKQEVRQKTHGEESKER